MDWPEGYRLAHKSNNTIPQGYGSNEPMKIRQTFRNSNSMPIDISDDAIKLIDQML